jgi:hypothetical protein
VSTDQTPLSRLASVVQALLDADCDVEVAEGCLARAKERARVLREETIPEMMNEMAVKEVVLEDGSRLTIKREFYAMIPADKKPLVYSWLDRNGHGGMIKKEVTCSFGMGQKQEADALLARLLERKYDASYSETVHPMTMKAFIGEMIKKGEALPIDLFNPRIVNVTHIKKRK